MFSFGLELGKIELSDMLDLDHGNIIRRENTEDGQLDEPLSWISWTVLASSTPSRKGSSLAGAIDHHTTKLLLGAVGCSGDDGGDGGDGGDGRTVTNVPL